MQQHLKPNCDKNDVEITDLGGPVEGTGSTAASPSLANFMESFLTALRKFTGFWGSNRGFFFFMSLKVTADFWLSPSGICDPTNKWGKNQPWSARAGSQVQQLIPDVLPDVAQINSFPAQSQEWIQAMWSSGSIPLLSLLSL